MAMAETLGCKHSLIAYDKSGNIIAGGVEVLDKEFEQNDKTILGMIRVDVGVARIGLGASWVKSGGELTGEESMSLSLSQRDFYGEEVSQRSDGNRE